MKKILILSFLALFVVSCSLGDDDFPNFRTEFVGIERVEIPESFKFDSVHKITMTYLRPTTCHLLLDFVYEADQNQRTIAIRNSVMIDQECNDLIDDEVEVAFDFKVTSMDPYIFRFYKGEDATGDDSYFTVEVPVVE